MRVRTITFLSILGLASCGEDEPAPPAQSVATAAPAAVTTAASSVASAGFVDESACAACHPKEAELWRGSHHDLAMQPATNATVLGDFGDAHFQDQSTDTLFTRDGERFVVETEGPDGKRARFAAPYVFGVDPLQQVLLELPKGRLQALSVAWDPAAKRWFSLYPDEHIDARDPLHWTRAPENWNFSCAECHATDLRRNYDAEHDAYATTWNRLDVGCQACHGPGERHVAWTSGARTGAAPEHAGFDAPRDVSDSTREIERCARCHARRSPLGDGFDPRHRLLDDYLPALLTEGLYHADGQIQDEVYEYGSFLESKMHARGVRCSDCHEPHALTPRAPGNLLCTSCHSPTPAPHAHVDLTKLQRKNYDTPEHHHHAPGTIGAQCVDCHMPTRTYMIVDPRRDHGFRVPRPDLAAETGAPDVCARCHAERDAAWSAARIAEWSGPVKREPHFGSALQAARTGRAGAVDGLLALLKSDAPPIARATALVELQRYPSQVALAAAAAALGDGDGLVRLAAVSSFEVLPPEQRAGALGASLRDPLRGVRIEAARLVAGLAAEALGPFQADATAALAEYEAVQHGLLERPEAHLNLAQLALARGDRATAERELGAALRIDPLFVPAYVNMADLLRESKGEREAEGGLRDGLGRVPDAAALHHALGLALVRQQRSAEGLPELARAAELAPEDPRFGYVHAVALHDLGQKDAAVAALRKVLARHPGDRDTRFALAGYLQEADDTAGAARCLAELAAINPYDPDLASAVAPPGAGR
jgi:tetratricopeptide (TPR) repeat protein